MQVHVVNNLPQCDKLYIKYCGLWETRGCDFSKFRNLVIYNITKNNYYKYPENLAKLIKTRIISTPAGDVHLKLDNLYIHTNADVEYIKNKYNL